MKAGNFTGITGFPNQDIAMWVTMGPIADRTQDRLGASDLAIVEFRKQMVEAVRSFASGAPAIGTGEARFRRAYARSRRSCPRPPTGGRFNPPRISRPRCRPHKPSKDTS